MNVRTNINTVGVVGCGQMGSGYAQLCAQKGFFVVVFDIDDAALKNGLKQIELRLAEGVKKGEFSGQDKDRALLKIKGVTKFAQLVDCDLVIEAATEKMEVKKSIFTELERICPADVILATNTSVLSVLDIAVVTSRSQNVVGLHMNPLMMPATEIIRTVLTSDETLKAITAFARTLGKKCITAPDIPGFIGNRLITPLFLNAIRMIESRTTSKEDIDATFTVAFGWPMGPLAMVDAIGLDTLLYGATAMYEDLKDPQFTPPVILKKMVTAGWLGCKAGKGFYEYT